MSTSPWMWSLLSACEVSRGPGPWTAVGPGSHPACRVECSCCGQRQVLKVKPFLPGEVFGPSERTSSCRNDKTSSHQTSPGVDALQDASPGLHVRVVETACGLGTPHPGPEQTMCSLDSVLFERGQLWRRFGGSLRNQSMNRGLDITKNFVLIL